MIFFWILVLFTKINAYPQFFTQNTERCIKCHTSENGHGFLNSNGKLYATEQWAENESKYYQIELPENFDLGFRTKHQQKFYQSDYIKYAEFKDLNIEIRAEYRTEKLRTYLSLSRFTPVETDVTFKDFIYVSDFYMSYSLNSYLNFKAGKYFLNYGLDQFNLNYDQNAFAFSSIQKGQEKTQVTIFYNQDNNEMILSKIFSRAIYNKQFSEDGFLFSYKQFFLNQLMVGFNIFKSDHTQSTQANSDKTLICLFASFNYDAETSIFFQLDQITDSNNKKGSSFFIRPNYKFRKGHLFTSGLKYINYDIEQTDPKFLEFSLGYQYFPYAQFNIFTNFKKTTNTMNATFADDQKSDSLNIDFNFLM